MDLDVHFGSNLASKTTPGGTPTQKGGPSILNNRPSIFTGFGRVAVAGVSRERTLKRETLHYEVQLPKWLQNDPELDPKRDQNGTKNYAEIASESYAKFCKPRRRKDSGPHPPQTEGFTQPL